MIATMLEADTKCVTQTFGVVQTSSPDAEISKLMALAKQACVMEKRCGKMQLMEFCVMLTMPIPPGKVMAINVAVKRAQSAV